MDNKPIAQLKGDERRWKIERAAGTLKEYAALLRDKPLLKLAREELKNEIANTQKALKA